MPLNWHFFNFIFIGCFFFRIICVSCLHEICNTFQSIQVEKKITQKLSKFRFLIKKFFLARMNFFTCENNVRLYTI